MAATLKYGHIAIAGVPADEPVFVLRAQDAAAVQTIMYYRASAEAHGADAELVEGVSRAVNDITRWQFAHPGRVKVPD